MSIIDKNPIRFGGVYEVKLLPPDDTRQTWQDWDHHEATLAKAVAKALVPEHAKEIALFGVHEQGQFRVGAITDGDIDSFSNEFIDVYPQVVCAAIPYDTPYFHQTGACPVISHVICEREGGGELTSLEASHAESWLRHLKSEYVSRAQGSIVLTYTRDQHHSPQSPQVRLNVVA